MTKNLGIKLPVLVLIVKNMERYFTFEVQVLDDKGIKRRFRASNFQSTTRVKPFICTMPLRMEEKWNQLQLNLANLTKRAYGTNFVEVLRVQVHANCRLRRIFFSDRLYKETELPAEFKLYLPITQAKTDEWDVPFLPMPTTFFFGWNYYYLIVQKRFYKLVRCCWWRRNLSAYAYL